ncbi:MAG: family 16 glycoside hydrolase [Bacteroidales bacterium]
MAKTGANYAMHNASDKRLKPVDEFNSSRIIVRRVQHYLNGDLIVDYQLWTDDWKARKNNGKWDVSLLWFGTKRTYRSAGSWKCHQIQKHSKVRDLTDVGYPLLIQKMWRAGRSMVMKNGT